MHEQLRHTNDDVTDILCRPWRESLQFARQILAGGSLLRSGQTQVGENKIGEHAQWFYFASVTQTLR
jgi:hypothetical protein